MYNMACGSSDPSLLTSQGAKPVVLQLCEQASAAAVRLSMTTTERNPAFILPFQNLPGPRTALQYVVQLE